jgi:hypothetical protein
MVAVVRDGVNCCVEPARTFAALGDIVKVSLGGGPGWVYPVGDNAQLEVINTRVTTNSASIDERRTMPPQAGWDTKLTLANSELEEVCVPVC